MAEPPDLQRVRLIDALCHRWCCLPSELLREDAGLVLGMLGVLGEAGGAEKSKFEDMTMEQQLAAVSRSNLA